MDSPSSSEVSSLLAAMSLSVPTGTREMQLYIEVKIEKILQEKIEPKVGIDSGYYT